MAEKVTLAKIDFDFGSAIADISQLSDSIVKLKDRNKELKKEGKESSEEFQANAVQLKKLTTEYRVQQKVITDFTQQQADLNKVITETDGSIKQLEAALRRNKELYRRLSAEERENEKIGGKLLKLIKQQDDEYKRLQVSIGTTQVKVGDYAGAMREVIQEQGGLSALFTTNTAELQAFRSGLIAARNTFSGTSAAIGGTSKALRILKAALISTGVGAFIVVLGSLISLLTRSQKVIDFVKAATEGLRFAFENIGETIFRVGQQIFESFDSPREAIKALGKAIVDNVLNRFRAVGQALNAIGQGFRSLVKRDFEGVKQAAEDLGQAIVQSVTGLDERQQEKLVNGVRKIGAEFRDGTKAAFDYQQQLNQLKKAEADLEVQQEKSRATIKDLNKIAEDTTKSTQEREKAARDAIALEQQNLKAQEDIIAERVEILKAQNELTTSNEEDLQRVRDAEIELARVQRESLELQTTLNNKLNVIRQTRATAEQKAAKETAKVVTESIEKIQDKFEEQDKAIKEVLAQSDDQAKVEQAAYEERLKQLNIFGLDREDLTAEQLEAIQILEEKHQEKLSEIRVAAIDKRIKETDSEIEREALQRRINLERELQDLGDNEQAKQELKNRFRLQELELQKQQLDDTLQIIQQELARQEQLSASVDVEGSAVADAVLSEEDEQKLRDRLLAVAAEIENLNTLIGEATITITQDGETSFLQQILGLDDEGFENFQERFAIVTESASQVFNLASAGIEARTQKQIAQLDKLRERDAISQEEYDKRKAAIEKKAFERQKKLQILTATVSYLQGIINTLSAPTTIPDPFGAIYKGVQIGFLTASYGIQISKIRSQQFAEGGLIDGAPHSRGGVPFSVRGHVGFEAEGGEYLINKRATQKYLPIIEAINSSTLVGIRSKRQSGFFQDGGLVTRSIESAANVQNSQSIISGIFDSEAFADAVASAVAEIPAPVLNIVEFNRENDRQTQIKDLTRV